MANLREIALQFEDESMALLAHELRTGPHIHTQSGDLKASFRADGDTVVSDIPYAETELFGRHPGQLEAAWDAIEQDAVDLLGELITEQLNISGIQVVL